MKPESVVKVVLCRPQSAARALEQSSAWERIQQRALEAQIQAKKRAEGEANKPGMLFIPGMDKYMRAMPNYLSRSRLFAPVAWEKRQMYEGSDLIDGSEKVTLKGWGRQLTEDVADIWFHALYLCSKAPMGQAVRISRWRFLQDLGRHSGGYAYDWLHRGVIALSTFTIAIEARTADGIPKFSIGTRASSRVMHMLDGFDYCASAREYRLCMDPRWREIFANREYGLVDWEKRLRMGQRQYQAKSLQRLVSVSSDRVQRYGLEFLKKRAQYGSHMSKFRKNALEPAMRELERLDVIAEGRIERSLKGAEQAVWIKL